jgi:hypothetical protein
MLHDIKLAFGRIGGFPNVVGGHQSLWRHYASMRLFRQQSHVCKVRTWWQRLSYKASQAVLYCRCITACNRSFYFNHIFNCAFQLFVLLTATFPIARNIAY